MYSFFVLGLVPGTSIQITFLIWLDSLLVLIEAISVIWLYRRYSLHIFKRINKLLYLLVETFGNMHRNLDSPLNYSEAND